MQTSEATIGYLDCKYVYSGTPAELLVPGPYSVEAFFELNSSQDDLMDPIQWLISRKIPHQAEIETHYKENGLFLRISFASEDLRNLFISQYTADSAKPST